MGIEREPLNESLKNCLFFFGFLASNQSVMWATLQTLPLPFGDTYLVQKENKIWRGVVRNKDGEERVQCGYTYSKYTVLWYADVVRMAQEEALRGLNPFVSKEYALRYSKR